MTKIVLLSVATVFVGSLSLIAQTGDSLNKPLSETELMRTIDSLGNGDPATKAPLSAGESSGRDGRKGEEKNKQGVKGATEITAREASFDQKANQAVFAGDVKVNNPEFRITCDKLTAFLNDENGKEKSSPAATGVMGKPGAVPAPSNSPAAKSGNAGGLKKVIAEGSVVITQDKLDADGKVNRSIGRGERAVYDSATGDVTLTGKPSLQQGINTIVATDPSTVMILNREGRLKIFGPSTTVIQETPENPTVRNAR